MTAGRLFDWTLEVIRRVTLSVFRPVCVRGLDWYRKPPFEPTVGWINYLTKDLAAQTLTLWACSPMINKSRWMTCYIPDPNSTRAQQKPPHNRLVCFIHSPHHSSALLFGPLAPPPARPFALWTGNFKFNHRIRSKRISRERTQAQNYYIFPN